MSKYEASIKVANKTGVSVSITLWYKHKGVPQSQTWDVVANGGTTSPMTIKYDGDDNSDDAWSIKLALLNGGAYQSGGSDNWTKCPMSSKYDGGTYTFSVDTQIFDIALPTATSSSMRLVSISETTQIDNVFVLMLENHSFDNIFAFSNIGNIQPASASDTNSYDGTTYAVSKGAPLSMPTDPGHEFEDVLVQLCGPPPNGESVADWRVPWTSYNQPINNSGFAANYATSTTEKPHKGPALPTSSQIGDIMACFDTPNQLPIIYTLATEFALCYRWFSSLPGPTWPNRFFVHGASSNGWADSPGNVALVEWNLHGFRYLNGSVYTQLNSKGLGWRIYHDKKGALTGRIPQVLALEAVHDSDLHKFADFAKDLQNPYPYAYTFIEPNYGDVALGTYKGGSSQHPMDSMVGGEALIKATYEALRVSPLWSRSLLIITYDEHGGFYDSMAPGPAQAPHPNLSPDKHAQKRNKYGFLFDWYGVRVPAVIVSPQIQKGVVDGTVYDHASVSATLNAIFATGTLTFRDSFANNLTHLLSTFPPRDDCTVKLPKVSTKTIKDDAEEIDEAALAAQPMPESGNAVGLLMLLGKRHLSLEGGDETAVERVKARMAAIKTRGDLAAYAAELEARLEPSDALSEATGDGTDEAVSWTLEST